MLDESKNICQRLRLKEVSVSDPKGHVPEMDDVHIVSRNGSGDGLFDWKAW